MNQERRASINIEFHNMEDSMATPLFYALRQNDLEMAKILLDHGARLNAHMVDAETGVCVCVRAWV